MFSNLFRLSFRPGTPNSFYLPVTAIISGPTHYGIIKIKSMDDVRDVFTDDYLPQYNWLFLSTNGVHGNSNTLDELEEYWDVLDTEDDNYVGHEITVLILQPRVVTVRYGHIDIEKEDIPWLRSIVKKTLDAVEDSQWDNF